MSLAAVACGPIDQSGGGAARAPAPDGGTGSAPAAPIEIRIVSPADGGKCKADARGSCVISVAVSGARLASPGGCGGAQQCGHIDLYVDGNACGSPNVQSSSDDVAANFSRCGKVEGKHALQVELRDDRGALLAQSPVVRVEVEKEKHRGDHDGDDDGDEGGGDDNGGHG